MHTHCYVTNKRFGYKRLIGIHFIILVEDQFERRHKHAARERERE